MAQNAPYTYHDLKWNEMKYKRQRANEKKKEKKQRCILSRTNAEMAMKKKLRKQQDEQTENKKN